MNIMLSRMLLYLSRTEPLEKGLLNIVNRNSR
jgi:hypothetical protein